MLFCCCSKEKYQLERAILKVPFKRNEMYIEVSLRNNGFNHVKKSISVFFFEIF